MATLRRSNGTIIASNLTDYTVRRIVEQGHGSATTAGDKKFTDVTLIAGQDAAYLAASSPSPVTLGLDHVHFTPKRYPES